MSLPENCDNASTPVAYTVTFNFECSKKINRFGYFLKSFNLPKDVKLEIDSLIQQLKDYNVPQTSSLQSSIAKDSKKDDAYQTFHLLVKDALKHIGIEIPLFTSTDFSDNFVSAKISYGPEPTQNHFEILRKATKLLFLYAIYLGLISQNLIGTLKTQMHSLFYAEYVANSIQESNKVNIDALQESNKANIDALQETVNTLQKSVNTLQKSVNTLQETSKANIEALQKSVDDLLQTFHFNRNKEKLIAIELLASSLHIQDNKINLEDLQRDAFFAFAPQEFQH